MKQYQKVAVHALIEREDGKILVTRRSQVNDFMPNIFDIPGGTIEFGETPEVALKREVFEETNLKVDVVNPVYVTTEIQKNERHQFWIIYNCVYLGGEIKLNPEEHDDYKWVNFEEINKLDCILFLKNLLVEYKYGNRS